MHFLFPSGEIRLCSLRKEADLLNKINDSFIDNAIVYLHGQVLQNKFFLFSNFLKL